MSNTFQEFLELLPEQREVGLAVAKDDQGAEQLVKELEKNNFLPIENIFAYDKINGNKYLIINDENYFKPIYDFICQYPLTIIKIFNQASAQNVTIRPDYEQAFLLVITKENLVKFEQEGFDILGRVGLTYQS